MTNSMTTDPPPIVHHLHDDGVVPNNGSLPLVILPKGLPDACRRDPDKVLALFAANRWIGGWINGIYAFQHYHSNAHEVLGIAAGEARVQFGGPNGPVLEVAAGDVVVIPAGVAHCRVSNPEGLVVVGAYPAGQADVDLCRDSTSEREKALQRIPLVPLPDTDPIGGESGGLTVAWSLARSRGNRI